MIGFRDMTFCTQETCAMFDKGCERALTKEVKADAKKWWGNEEAPISIFADKPDCFIKKSA